MNLMGVAHPRLVDSAVEIDTSHEAVDATSDCLPQIDYDRVEAVMNRLLAGHQEEPLG